ncbi:MAG: DUF1501 domain-containing protein [Planctomycetota bacterium]
MSNNERPKDPQGAGMWQRDLRRRTFLRSAGLGFGSVALKLLLNKEAMAAPAAGDEGVLKELHFPPRAKRIIHLCMAGGPSQLESFDYKPRLKELDGQPFPESFTAGQQLAQLQNTPLKAFGPQTEFRKWGASGQEISELFPEIGGIADQICILRSLHTEQINHDPAHAFMNSGSIIKGRPSMGSWLLYGLGNATENLPGFVVMTSTSRCGGAQPISARQWSAGFLPSRFQGVQFQSRGAAVHYIGNPEGVCQSAQRQLIDEVNQLNRLANERYRDPELETRIAQYELAARMQTSIPELTDFSGETQETLDLYGVKQPGDGSFASNCLLARRLAERGVRMIQLYHRAWDHHGNLKNDMAIAARDVDRASAALVRDLQRLGMLDETIVIWGGEFGRTPMGQGNGRDHHILSMCAWVAGGGFRGGLTYGATDELGYRAVEDPVSVHDLHATLLRQFGVDHKRLTYRYQGRDFRLTDVSGEIVTEICQPS